MNRLTKATAASAATAILLAAHAHASLVSVTTETDSNGYYRYTFSAGTEPFRLGGDTNLLSVRLPSLGIVAVPDTPNWTWSTNEPDVILWRYAGSNNLVLDDGSVSFALTSSYDTFAPYDALSLTGPLQQGMLIGEVYGTNRVIYTSAATGDVVVSFNVAGYERFSHVGPVVPEPGAVLAVCGLLVAAGTFRTR